MFLGVSFGMHGTLDQYSLGWASSHGCIRMKNDEVAELYKTVPIGTEVTIIDGIYGPFGKGFRKSRNKIANKTLLSICFAAKYDTVRFYDAYSGIAFVC